MFSPLSILAVAAWACVFCGCFTLGWVAARAQLPERRRLGLRGVKRAAALAERPAWSAIEPSVRWLGARVVPWLGPATRARLDRQLTLAGDALGLLPEEVTAMSLMCGLAGGSIATVLGWMTGLGPTMTWVGALLGGLIPIWVLQSTGSDRVRYIERRLPHAIDLLALAMGAGLDFPGSMSRVVEKAGTRRDPLVEEFALVLQCLQLGQTRRQALEQFAARTPSAAVTEFVAALIQAELRGHPVAEVLRIQSEVARRKRSLHAEESAARAGVAMMGPLVLMFLGILVLIVGPMLIRLSGP
ncbi:MAG TPA: type II secretion system F family protein [Polyangiaceae bacterium]|nr:type II secretion system F family protein [Polyangiaceae bacterium]